MLDIDSEEYLCSQILPHPVVVSLNVFDGESVVCNWLLLLELLLLQTIQQTCQIRFELTHPAEERISACLVEQPLLDLEAQSDRVLAVVEALPELVHHFQVFDWVGLVC